MSWFACSLPPHPGDRRDYCDYRDYSCPSRATCIVAIQGLSEIYIRVVCRKHMSELIKLSELTEQAVQQNAIQETAESIGL